MGLVAELLLSLMKRPKIHDLPKSKKPSCTQNLVLLYCFPLKHTKVLGTEASLVAQQQRICLQYKSCRRYRFDPLVGKIPLEEMHGNALQYSCLENLLDRGTWQATVLRVTKSWTWLKWLSTHAHTISKEVIKKTTNVTLKGFRNQPKEDPTGRRWNNSKGTR